MVSICRKFYIFSYRITVSHYYFYTMFQMLYLFNVTQLLYYTIFYMKKHIVSIWNTSHNCCVQEIKQSHIQGYFMDYKVHLKYTEHNLLFKNRYICLGRQRSLYYYKWNLLSYMICMFFSELLWTSHPKNITKALICSWLNGDSNGTANYLANG